GKMDENIESLGNLQENLKEHGLDISGMPIVLQYNKRDLADVYSVEELEEALNSWEAPHFEAVARDGQGVFPTLKRLAGMVLESLNDQHAAKRSSSIAISRDRRTAIAHSGSAATAVASPAAPVAASERTGTSRVSLTADASTAPATRVRTMVQEVPARPVAAGPRIAISTSPRRRKRRAGLLLGLLFATAITATVLLHLAGVIRILP
ncbi:MAG: GTPase domain-containing protein, partial [Planctomycetota bacterium]